MQAAALARRVLASRAGLAAAVLRVAAGAVFLGFSVGKFAHHARETAAFDRYGLPLPGTFVTAIGVLELAGGALLVLGLATRPAALALAGDMVGAIATGGRVDGGFLHLVLAPLLLLAMLALLALGGGRLALDRRLLARAGARSGGQSSSLA